MTRRALFPICLAVAVSLHVLAFVAMGDGGTRAAGAGSSGDGHVTLVAASAALAQQVSEWTRPPEVHTPADMPSPLGTPLQALPPALITTPPDPSAPQLPPPVAASETAPKQPTQSLAPPVIQAPTATLAAAIPPLPAPPVPSPRIQPPPPASVSPTPARPTRAAPTETAPARPASPPAPRAQANVRPTPPPAAQASPTQVQSAESAHARAAGSSKTQTKGDGGADQATTGNPNRAASLKKRWGAAIIARVERQKRHPRGGAQGTVRLSLEVASKGQLVSVSISHSSGNAAMDQAALRAVKKARMPRAPKALGTGTYSFSFRMRFKG